MLFLLMLMVCLLLFFDNGDVVVDIIVVFVVDVGAVADKQDCEIVVAACSEQ